jgi:hypothetical protein
MPNTQTKRAQFKQGLALPAQNASSMHDPQTPPATRRRRQALRRIVHESTITASSMLETSLRDTTA